MKFRFASCYRFELRRKAQLPAFILLAVMALAIDSVHAQSSHQEVYHQLAEKLRTEGLPDARKSCPVAPHSKLQSQKAGGGCYSEQMRRFFEKGEMTIALGYFNEGDDPDQVHVQCKSKEEDPRCDGDKKQNATCCVWQQIVTDEIMRKEFEELLTSECPKGTQGACGFKRINETTYENPNVIDPDGKKRKITIHLAASAYSQLDLDNLENHKKCNEQRELYKKTGAQMTPDCELEACVQTEKMFYDCVANGGFCVFNGHSRASCTMEFCPKDGPYRKPSDEQKSYPGRWNSNYSLYKLESAANNPLLKALNETSNPPVGIAYFGCKTAECLGEPLRKYPNTTTVLTEGLLHSTFGMVWALVDGLLGQRCCDGVQCLLDTAFQSQKPSRAVVNRLCDAPAKATSPPVSKPTSP